MTLDTSPKTYGEPSIEALASGLGTLGRYGDNYMVHAAEGETIVPREVLEQNPGLKEDLFRQMTMMGIENPNRYVVGDQLNSINPITGQPEFFFKKIFRAIKKVVKKAAPIIVPMLGNMILPGIGGLIASGLYTKAQGGSWGDALKAAGMAYLGNVASAGIMGGINAPSGQFFDGFSKGIGQGITAPYDAVRGLIQGGSASPYQQGLFGKSTVPGMLKQYDTQYLDIPSASDMNIQTTPNPVAAPAEAVTASPPVGGDVPTFQEMNIPRVSDYTGGDVAPEFSAGQTYTHRPLSVGESLVGRVASPRTALNIEAPSSGAASTTPGASTPGAGEQLTIGGENYTRGEKYVFNNKEYIADVVVNEKGIPTPKLVEAPSGIGKFYEENIRGPVANIVGDKAATPVILGGGALLANAFSEDPSPPPPNATQRQIEAYDAYIAARARGNLTTEQHLQMRSAAGLAPLYTRSELARIIGRDVSGLPDYYFARGRAGGGEVMGPGTGTSDSIPARLSDGEFVMTARAVRNAGGGDRSLGAARMYDMMNRFEQGAA
jgi:hypothetical protein